ncbi:MAG: hypothetical protein WCX65_09400 [bacterium]
MRRNESPGHFQDTRASSLGIIEFLATGAKPLIADLFWIKATTLNANDVFEITKKRAAEGKGIGSIFTIEADVPRTPKDNRDLYDLISNVTYLDPTFEYAYYYGATLLSWDGELTLATSLLDKGLHNNMRSAMLASSMSFIYYYFYKDWDMGAYYSKMSYQFSGKYSATPKAVANLYAAGRRYDLAITFLSDTMATAKDKDSRKQMEEQIKYLFVEKYIEYLEKALQSFKERAGVYPPSLETLVKYRIIPSVPKDPFGGKFVITGPGLVENKPHNRFEHFADMRVYSNSTPTVGRDLVK